jgi:hypothetical protein
MDELGEHGRRVGTPCAYCKVEMTRRGEQTRVTRDHIVPVVAYRTRKVPRPTGNNIAWVCHRCNNDKADKMIDDWLDELRAADDPRTPVVAKFLGRREPRETPAVWFPTRWA